jgi:hypothetical protein
MIASIEKNQRETVQVTSAEFNGHQLLDIRTHYEADGDLRPTIKGIALKIG